MKNILIILALAATTAISSAQNTPPSQRTTRRPVASRSVAPRVDVPIGLKENITLHLHGSFQGLVPLDLELTGTGPTFTTDLIKKAEKEGEQPTIISFNATVFLNTDDSYRIEYTLGARIALATGRTAPRPGVPTTHHIEYREITLRGTANLTNGKPLVISKLNGASLSLSANKVNKAKE